MYLLQLVAFVFVLWRSGNCVLYEHATPETTAIAEVTVVTLKTEARYVGRSFSQLTLIPKWGCVAFGSVSDPTVITFESIRQYELLCPLFSQHSVKPIADDDYLFKYEEFSAESPLATEVQRDLNEVGNKLYDSSFNVVYGMIVTWENARSYKSDEVSEPEVVPGSKHNKATETNTYQIAIVVANKTDSTVDPYQPYYTFAVFNYLDVTWTGWVPSNSTDGESYRGFAGLVYGDYKGEQALPFASNDDEIKEYLALKSSIISKTGRYVYDVTENPQRIGCLDLSLYPAPIDRPEPVTTSVSTADIFGGKVVRLQGQCKAGTRNTTVYCDFAAYDENDEPTRKREVGIFLDEYTLICKTPSLDFGRNSISMSYATPIEQGAFRSDFYVNAPTADTAHVQINDGFDKNFMDENALGNITLTWQSEIFNVAGTTNLEVTIVGYKSISNKKIITRSFKIGEVLVEAGAYSFDVSNVQCVAEPGEDEFTKCDGFLIGQFYLQIKNYESNLVLFPNAKRVGISSLPIPIGWYVRSYHRIRYGRDWYFRFCETPKLPLQTLSCPCTRQQAEFDTRQFTPAPDCQYSTGRNRRCLLQADDSYCFNGLPQTQSGIRCCYDTNDNLISGSENPLVGSHKLTYSPYVNFNEFQVQGARTYLSFYLSYVKNHYSCCTAHGLLAQKTAFCSGFASVTLTPGSCRGYSPSAITAIVGDPHFMLPDSKTYTFNGIGEYWYAYTSPSDTFTTKIQIRLAKATSLLIGGADDKRVNATILEAVAIKVNENVIQVQVQPRSYLDDSNVKTKRLMILVNLQEVTWTDDQQVRFYNGFRIASSGSNQDRFHITALDDGALVACDYVETELTDAGSVSPGSMSCRVSYARPETGEELTGLIGQLVGGTYGLVKRSDIAAPVLANLEDANEVLLCGRTWAVAKAESFLKYIGTSWEEVNEEVESFEPVLSVSGITPSDASVEASVCGDSENAFFAECSYDYRLTGSSALAKSTIDRLLETAATNEANSLKQEYCDALELPLVRTSLSNGSKVGSIAKIDGCVRNYVPANPVTLPQTLECKVNESGDQYVWEGEKLTCIQSSLYDTSTANVLSNSLSNATAEDLDMKDFSATYLGRRVYSIKAYVRAGCIVLMDTVEPGYEPMICPMLADHAGQPAADVEDKFKFLYETFNSSDTTGTLASISADIRVAGQNLDRTVGMYGIQQAYMFTWLDATYNGADCSTTELCNNQLRNTYQVTIAISGNGKTYVVLNYAKIEWSGLQSAGLNPTNYSVAGFYYGDRKGNLQLPFSGKNTSEIAKLALYGTLQTVPGRYIFEVSSLDYPRRIGCYPVNGDLQNIELLSLSTSQVDIFGGNLVRIQGACIEEGANFQCAFEQRTAGEPRWVSTAFRKIDLYSGVCPTPRLPEIDVGWSQIAMRVGGIIKFKSKIYFGTSKNGGGYSQLDFASPVNNFWLWTRPDTTVEIKWTETFGGATDAQLALYIVGYTKDTSIEFGPIARTSASSNSINISTSTTQCNISACNGILIGQFLLRVDANYLEDLYMTTDIQRESVTSVLMPIGWFTNEFHTSRYFSSGWYNNFCDSSPTAIVTATLPECPCTQALVKTEERLFFEAPDCTGFPSSGSNCLFSPGASMCYTTLPTQKGHSIRCCYKDGYLLQSQSSPLDGAFLLPDSVDGNYQVFNVTGAHSQLSYQLSHVKNYFACCSVNLLQLNLLTRSCSSLTTYRAPAKTCGGFRYSGWSAVVGDPHFVTLDGTKYTFNGVGEFWYVYSAEPNFETKIQVRLTQAFNNIGMLANASFLSALAFEFRGSVAEIHVQPWSFRETNRYLMILVDGKEQFWTGEDDQYHTNFKISTNENQFAVTVIASSNGPLIHCQYVDADAFKLFDGMSCRISLPNVYKQNTFGLSGYWDDDTLTDLAVRNYISWRPLFIESTDMKAVHYNFSLSWRVLETESIFSYFDDNWLKYNSVVDSFEPVLSLPPNLNVISNSTITATCGQVGIANRDQCQYDLELVKSGTFAIKTLTYLTDFDVRRETLEQIKVESCNYLDIPYSTFDYRNGTVVGSVAVFTGCLPGYGATNDSAAAFFTCSQSGENPPVWTPKPRNLCRGSQLYGTAVEATPLDPYSFEMPPYTLPSQAGRSGGGLVFGGRKINGFSWFPEIGCVALSLNATRVTADSVVNIRGASVPLLCPLFASYATSKGQNTADSYRLLFKQLTYPDTNLVELTRDIQSASDGLDTTVDQVEVTSAYIFTWSSARSESSNCSTDDACKTADRNDYEVVVAGTSKGTTYVIFSYENINWSGYENSTVSIKSSGVLHIGDNKGVVTLPYAGRDLAQLQLLKSTGTIIGFNGRFIYHVTDRIERIGCLNLPSPADKQPITMNTYVADVYGGRRLVLQAACLADNVENWECLFSKNPYLPSGWTAKSKLLRLNAYSAVCKPPRLPDVDVGEYYVGLSTGIESAWQYDSKIYFAGTISGTMPVKLVDNLVWFTAEPKQDLTIQWSPSEFANKQELVDVLLIAYNKNADSSFNRTEYLIARAVATEGALTFDPSDVVCDSNCRGLLIGQVAVRLQNQSAWLDSSLQYVEISSTIVPIGWYVNRWHVENVGPQWYYNYCEVKTSAPSFNCPCTATLAEQDNRVFIRAPNCNDVFGAECLVTSQAEKCFTTLPLNDAGNGLLCCYDAAENLIYPQDKPFGGSFELDYAPTASEGAFDVAGATGYLSYHYSHPKNLFACCSANLTTAASEKCFNYVESRSPLKTCTNYSASGVSAIVGDPHVLTADETIFTFNGVGEYWWVFGDEAFTRAVRIQARFQNSFKPQVVGAPVTTLSATLLTAVSFYFTTSEIEIEVQGPSYLAGGGRKLAIYVNGEEKLFYSSPGVMYYQGTRIESSALQDFVHVSTPFGGPSIDCTYIEISTNPTFGAMSCVILLPPTYKGNAYGLLGKWDGNLTNDLVKRPDIALSSPPVTNSEDLRAVHEFGKTWRLLPDETRFNYYGTNFEEVNEKIDSFNPEFSLQPPSFLNLSDIAVTCLGPGAQYSERCEYDYRITNSRSFAASTGSRLRDARGVQLMLGKDVTDYCSQLDIPYAIKTFTNGIKLNSVANVVSCVNDYVLNASLPKQYRCIKSSGVTDWSPAPNKNVCVRIDTPTTVTESETTTTAFISGTPTLFPTSNASPGETSQALATGTPSSLPLASSSPSSQSASSPSSQSASSPSSQSASSPSSLKSESATSSGAATQQNDATVEIILGVLLGVVSLVCVGMVVFYFFSLKPTLTSLNAHTSATVKPTNIEEQQNVELGNYPAPNEDSQAAAMSSVNVESSITQPGSSNTIISLPEIVDT